MRRRIKATSSPSMVVACIAVVLALTGSAFAATLITGADIQNGSITRADIAKKTLKSLKGKRGKTGPAGADGFVGPQGPQGSTGPEGPRGSVGPAGPQGPKGTTGDTGARGAKGDKGDTGDTGATGATGQALIWNSDLMGPTDVGAALASTSAGPDINEGAEVSNGGTYLPTGQYKIDVLVSFVDTNAADPGTEYGVARLFLSASGQLDSTTLVTSDIPDDQNNVAQASGSFIVNVGDDGGGGEQLTLRAALRTDDPGGANVSSTIIVTRIG